MVVGRVWIDRSQQVRLVREFVRHVSSSEDFSEETEKELRSICKSCQRPIKILPGGFTEEHLALCGKPCLDGGVPVGDNFHHSQCSLCFPKRAITHN